MTLTRKIEENEDTEKLLQSPSYPAASKENQIN